MSRRRPYSGLCVGGPLAGYSIVMPSPVLTVEERNLAEPLSAKHTNPSGLIIFAAERYRWIEIEGLGLWILEGTTPAEAMAELALSYSGEINK